MPKIEELYSRKKEASGQVSAQTRTLALGFLAISWALLTAHDEPLRTLAAHIDKSLILSLAAVAFITLVLDMLQYLALTKMAGDAFRLAEDAEKPEGSYDRDSFAYIAQAFFFWAKFIALAVGSIILVIIFVFLFRQ